MSHKTGLSSKEHNWLIRGKLLEMTQSAWYCDATTKDGTNQYREWAAKAADVLTSGLPWHNAVLGVKDVTIGEHKDHFAIVDIRQDAADLVSIPVKKKAFGVLTAHPVGTALSVQMDTSSDRPLVVGIRQRNGKVWDIVAKVPALVVRVNTERGITTILAEDGEECVCYHNDVPSARSLTPGTVVECAVVKDTKRTRIRDVVTFGGSANSVHWKEYGGLFRPREKGGGHVGDVFVHARLTVGFVAEAMVRGVAIKATDSETRRSWWEAVSATSGDNEVDESTKAEK